MDQWILSPCQNRRFRNLTLFLPSGKTFGKNSPIARLAGYFDNPNTEEGGKCIKEVVVIRAYVLFICITLWKLVEDTFGRYAIPRTYGTVCMI